jgi:hypothetical protein
MLLPTVANEKVASSDKTFIADLMKNQSSRSRVETRGQTNGPTHRHDQSCIISRSAHRKISHYNINALNGDLEV